MRVLEGLFLWAGIVFYIVSFSLFLLGILFKKDRHASLAWKAFIITFILHTLTIIVRWIESGHPPVLWTYEHTLASSWFVALVFILAGNWTPSIRVVGVAVAPIVLLILGYGIMSHGLEIEPLPPPYQSNWLWVHVTFAWLAYSAFAFAAVVAVLQLLKIRSSGDRGGGLLARLPGAETLEDLTFRIICFGFVSLAVEMGAGAIWAFGLWGRYWAWDPMETWTLISWLTYGLYLHLRVGMGGRGASMAWLAIIAFCFIFITFGGVGYMKGLHATLI
jgi:cytochrome c-type biogenesis protein CcsB